MIWLVCNFFLLVREKRKKINVLFFVLFVVVVVILSSEKVGNYFIFLPLTNVKSERVIAF